MSTLVLVVHTKSPPATPPWIIRVHGGNLVTRRHCKLLGIIHWCHAHSTAGKKDELETRIVTSFCPGNLKEYNEALPCWFKKKVENRSKRWNNETLGLIKIVADQKHLALYFWKHLWAAEEPFRDKYCHSWFLCWWMDCYRKRPWSILTSFFFFFFPFWNNFRQDNFENSAKNSCFLHPDFLVVNGYHICLIIFLSMYVYFFWLIWE